METVSGDDKEDVEWTGRQRPEVGAQLGRSRGKPAEVMRALTKGLAMLYLLMPRQSCGGGMLEGETGKVETPQRELRRL